MKMLLRSILILALITTRAATVQAEPFETIKAKLASSPGLDIYFMSLVESSVFETVDSFPGVAHICADGRYLLQVGPDQFLYDGSDLYTYIPDNNQVTVESAANDNSMADQVTFISRLDDYYQTQILPETGTYRLIRRDSASEAIPDSLVVNLDSKLVRMEQISYYDINEELNRILLDSILFMDQCDSIRLTPSFPDSVETVKLF